MARRPAPSGLLDAAPPSASKRRRRSGSRRSFTRFCHCHLAPYCRFAWSVITTAGTAQQANTRASAARPRARPVSSCAFGARRRRPLSRRNASSISHVASPRAPARPRGRRASIRHLTLQRNQRHRVIHNSFFPNDIVETHPRAARLPRDVAQYRQRLRAPQRGSSPQPLPLEKGQTKEDNRL